MPPFGDAPPMPPRGPAALFLLLLPLLPAGPAAADGDGWSVVLEDPRGDADPWGLPAPLPVAADAQGDLREVALRESPDLLHVRLATHHDGQGLPLPPGTRHESLVALLVQPPSGSTVQVEILATADGFRLLRDGERLEGVLEVEEDVSPLGWAVAVSKWALRDADGPASVLVTSASLTTTTFDGRAVTDAGEPAVPFPLRSVEPPGVTPVWRRAEGVEFAAGPSVAVGPDGVVHVAYLVYNPERGTPTGLHHAVLADGRLRAERVADAEMPTRLHEDRRTQTAIAVDAAGVVHVLYEPSPNGPASDGVRYARREAGAWTFEDPAALASGPRLRVEDGLRASPALAAGAGRLVAALQEDDRDVVHLVERAASGWRLLRTLPGATLARVEVSPEGDVHAAWMRPTSDESPDRGVYGDLVHASGSGGWGETVVARGVIDMTKLRADSESDGSFAFALDARGVPHFAYETDRGLRGFAILREGILERHFTPLRPDHGNPQLRMRMEIDADGHAHLVTGYGGSDLYAVRAPGGAWYLQQVPRHEIFSLALTPDGRAVIAHTQPHGGATLALAYQAGGFQAGSDLVLPQELRGEERPASLPVPGPGMVGALAAAALAAAAVAARRR